MPQKHVYVLQDHLRYTMVETLSSKLQAAGLNGPAIKLNAHTHLHQLQKIGQEVFARRVALL